MSERNFLECHPERRAQTGPQQNSRAAAIFALAVGVSPRFSARRETEPRPRRHKNSWNPAAATRLGCGETTLTAGLRPRLTQMPPFGLVSLRTRD